jgi:hypothetical protein
MRVGNVIDRSFELLRREWRAALLLGLIMIGGTLLFLISLVAWVGISFSEFDPNVSPDVNEAVFFAGMVVFFVGGLLWGIASYVAIGIATRAAALGPEEGTGWSDLGSHAWPAFRGAMRLFGWGLLFGIAIAILFGLAIVPLAFLGDEVGAFALLYIAFFLFFMVAMVGLIPFWLVLTAAVFVDDASVPTSASRAWHLVRRAYWPSLGASLVLYLFSLVPLVGSLLVAVLTPGYQVALLEELEGLEA